MVNTCSEWGTVALIFFFFSSRRRNTRFQGDWSSDVCSPDPPRRLTAVPWGNSDQLRVGDWVLAIGNPFGLGGTVTQGIISARARDINAGPYDDFLQTD